jgi:tetratricopeptide (TPR) repeat protein/CHAT domain-containing protein
MQRVFARIAFLALFCVACATVEKVPPDARLVDAQRAFEEGQRLYTEGKYAEAVPLTERALVLREAVLGDAHPEVADCLDLLGRLHQQQGNHARAEPLHQRALAIREALLGKAHPDVATSLNNLARFYVDRGLYDRAEPLHERALAIQEAALGLNHPDVAISLNHLANLYKDQGLYDRAEPLYERALAIREAALGKDHPLVARSLNSLALLYWEQGLYAQAEPLYERALAIFEKALGKDHPDIAYPLNNLARLYKTQGFYARAEPLYERALAIWQAALGKDHPLVAVALNNLANLYKDQGLYVRAEPLHQRALAIREAALGKDHPLVARSLNNLAILYLEQGLYARAEPLYERALAIFEKTLGKDHPDIAHPLNNLANLYSDQGHYARAESLYERALAIREAALGKDHVDVAASLNNLAILYRDQGHYARAEPLHERAFAIWEAALGKDHPHIAHSLTNLALIRLAQRRLTDALPLFERAITLSEERLRKEALAFSEERLASFLQLLRIYEEHIYALLRDYPEDARVQRLALATILLRKNRSAEELAHTSRIIFRDLGAQDRDAFERLRVLRTRFAELLLAGPNTRGPADYQRHLKELAEQGDSLEADLARRSAPLRALRALPSLAEIGDRVAAALPRDGALIEFIVCNERSLIPRPGPPPSTHPSNGLRYLALMLFPDGRTQALDLGPAALIDQAILRLHDVLSRRIVPYQPAAQELHRLVFRPLMPLLGKTRRLFLSPDGQLALVSFAALHDGGRFLDDTFSFTYLTSGKELLPRPEKIPPARSVIVLADPDFGAAPASSFVEKAAPPPAERSPSLERFFSTRYAEVADQPWAPLPGTRQEAEAIQRLLPQAHMLLGKAATKQALLEVDAPGILHIATHGFFLEDARAPEATRGVGHFGAVGERSPVQDLPDPLLRSGLVLAGARAPKDQPRALRREDSLVTALELAGLDLWGTQMVVLSACDTGRGDIKLGQGVYGLRRALVVAGAETVVTSLWKVNDKTTRDLMEDYYRHLLAGQGRGAALREAMRALRRKHAHPHFWAPFIVTGRDGPLQELHLGWNSAHL